MAHILLIDDLLHVRRALTTVLESERHQVTQAQDGAQGIHFLITQKFDLVITDVLMPQADGLEILHHIEMMPNKPPVIAISGGSISMSADHALLIAKNKCNMILKKPVDNMELLTAVSKLLRESQAA